MKKVNATNLLLTVIAVCLSLNILIQLELFPSANAAPPPQTTQRVVITGISLEEFDPAAPDPLQKALPVHMVK